MKWPWAGVSGWDVGSSVSEISTRESVMSLLTGSAYVSTVDRYLMPYLLEDINTQARSYSDNSHVCFMSGFREKSWVGSNSSFLFKCHKSTENFVKVEPKFKALQLLSLDNSFLPTLSSSLILKFSIKSIKWLLPDLEWLFLNVSRATFHYVKSLYNIL